MVAFCFKRVFLKTIFEVGGHDFSKTNAPILLKFCTLLLDKIDSWLNEGFCFLWLQLILQVNTWPNFYRKPYCFAYNSAKNSNFNIFKNPSFNHDLYSPNNRKYLIFLFRIKLSWVILATARILFSKESPKASSQRLNFQYFSMKIWWNFVEMFFHMPKVQKKKFIQYVKKKLEKICFFAL